MFNCYKQVSNYTAKNKFSVISIVIVIFFCSCANNQSSKKTTTKTIAKVDNSSNTNNQADLKKLLQRDSKLAVDILNSALTSDDVDIAGYAAVYISRLKILSDNTVVNSALNACAKSDDILLQALCWRHLITSSKSALPKIEPSNDTVTQIFTAIALIKQGLDYSNYKNLFFVQQDGKISNRNTNYNFTVSPLLKAYDNSSIALALAFIKAKKRNQFTEKDNVKINTALKIRHQLFRSVAVEEPVFQYKNNSINSSKIPQKLESAFVNQSTDSLRKICIHGTKSLQQEAVLALAVKEALPQSLDFAAAAAVMQSKDEKTKIEGARTYLLLLERSKNQATNND